MGDSARCTALVLADTQPIFTIAHVTGGKTHREFPIRARWAYRHAFMGEHFGDDGVHAAAADAAAAAAADADADENLYHETEIILSLAQGGRSELSNTGMAVWTASAVLAAHTARSAGLREFVKGGCALELGCGCAAAWSIACALLGSSCVLATDGERAPLESARRNIRHNLARALSSATSARASGCSAPSLNLRQELRSERRRRQTPSSQLFDVVDVLRMQWGDVAAIDAACTKLLAAATARRVSQPVDEAVGCNDAEMMTRRGAPLIPPVDAGKGSHGFGTVHHDTGGNWLIGAADVVYFRQGHAALANTFARVAALHHLFYCHNRSGSAVEFDGGVNRQHRGRPQSEASCDSSASPAVRIVVVNQDRGHDYEKSFFVKTLAHRTFSADVLDSDKDGGWRVYVRFKVEQVSLNADVTFGEDPAKFILFEVVPEVQRVDAIDAQGNTATNMQPIQDDRLGVDRGSGRRIDGQDRAHTRDEPHNNHSPSWRLTIQDIRANVLPLLPSMPDDWSRESSDDNREGNGDADRSDHHDAGGRRKPGTRSRRYRPPKHMLQDFSLEDALDASTTISKRMPMHHSEGRPTTEERVPLPPATGVTTVDSSAGDMGQTQKAGGFPAASATMEELEDWAQSLNVI